MNLRIVSYNVRYFGHSTRGLAATRSSVKNISFALANLSPLADIICLQEVETSSLRSTIMYPKSHRNETQLERLMHLLDSALAAKKQRDVYEAFYFPAHVYRLIPGLPFYTTGLAILVHRHLTIDHHNTNGPEHITHHHVHAMRALKQTRICAHLRVRLENRSIIDLFNTHLSLPTWLHRSFWTGSGRLGYGPNQMEETRKLVSFVDRERQSDRFIVVGDFNAIPGSPVYSHLVGPTGWSDGFATCMRFGTDALREWATAGFANARMRLDHAFSGNGIEWQNFIDTHAFDDPIGRFSGLSDHVPIVGTAIVK